MNVITLFSGYDSQCLALDRLKRHNPQFEYDLVAWSEIDPNAIKAHNALFPQWENRNLGDVSKVDWMEVKTMLGRNINLLTYSSPCQDFSSAGLQKGGQQGSGTRSSLLWECERAIEQLRPKYLLFENVSALVSEKFRPTFLKWCLTLEKLGYTNHYQLMNAKDYGVPQNRLRVFMVSILGEHTPYYFPKPFPLTRRLKDVLEQNVAERYYLKDEQVQKLMAGMKADESEPAVLGWTRNEKGEITDRHPVNVANCVTAGKRDNTQNYILEPTIAAMRGRDKDNPNDRGKSTDNYTQRLEPKPDGISPAVINGEKDGIPKIVEPSVLTPVRTEYGKAIRKQYGDNNLPESRHNLTQLQPKQDGTSNTLTSVAKDNLLIEPTIIDATNDFSEEEKRTYTEYSPALRSSRSGLMTTEGIRIRRLTERELYRLMDVSEPDIDTLLTAPIPRTQHAKLAGNSIVVACLYHIFHALFIETTPPPNTQTQLF